MRIGKKITYGPVLQRYCQLQLTTLSSVIVLQPPLLCEGWGGRPLCLPNLHWPRNCNNSEQYTVQRFGIFRSPVRHFPERSWIVVVFPCFTVVKSFTIWYALLLLFLLIFSLISLYWSPTQFSFAFFMHILMLLFTSLYFSDPSGSILFFLISLLKEREAAGEEN